MTSDTTEWGVPIPVNGKRPAWLADDSRYMAQGAHAWYGPTDEAVMQNVHCRWDQTTNIRLPADHWAYTAINAGFEPWAGGDEAPADWDGGDVLWREGYVAHSAADWSTGQGMNAGPLCSDIIGYRKRDDEPSEASDGDYVRIKRMTWEEWRNATRFRYDDWADKSGLIKPDPTPAERIASETGIALDIVERVLAAS